MAAACDGVAILYVGQLEAGIRGMSVYLFRAGSS